VVAKLNHSLSNTEGASSIYDTPRVSFFTLPIKMGRAALSSCSKASGSRTAVEALSFAQVKDQWPPNPLFAVAPFVSLLRGKENWVVVEAQFQYQKDIGWCE